MNHPGMLYALIPMIAAPIAQTRIIWSLYGMLQFKDRLRCRQFATHLKELQAFFLRLSIKGFAAIINARHCGITKSPPYPYVDLASCAGLARLKECLYIPTRLERGVLIKKQT